MSGIGRREALGRLGALAATPALAHSSADALYALSRAFHHEASASEELFVFRSLDPHQGRTVRVLVDRILPETDGPGALAVRADEFVDLMLSDVLAPEDRTRFLAGLARLDAESRTSCGADFVDCPEPEQLKLMQAQEQEALALAREAPVELSWGRPKPPREHFFHLLKHLTLLAYYTSEAGLVGELGFEVIPGHYPGCGEG